MSENEARLLIDMSPHQQRVLTFMEKAGQPFRLYPSAPSEAERLTRARLILEEALELIKDGLGVSVSVYTEWGLIPLPLYVNTGAHYRLLVVKPFDLVETADGCADLSVVNVGTLISCGIGDVPLLEEVDNNNLAKFGPGHRMEDGKLIKPPEHPKPDIRKVLMSQGADLE